MESYHKKKSSKSKLKKTVKNILCRPEASSWPVVSDEHKQSIQIMLSKHKIELPEFKKPHWNYLKSIPKQERPKPPKIKKVDGLVFGISECCNEIQAGQCSVVIIEASVNPRLIVQNLIEACKNNQISYICLLNLRKISTQYFGIPTSALGVKCYYLPDLTKELLKVAEYYGTLKMANDKNLLNDVQLMDIDTTNVIKDTEQNHEVHKKSPYLHRTDKKSRIFIPLGSEAPEKVRKNFVGQSYIKFSEKQKADAKTYMNMTLKRISNNADRVNVKTNNE